ncbi:helix-turn-helix transcriptional regulator [Novisyntrophococcus fermenticellae]|uniref:helix-turn-helix transcriptional regulator n=1 Tax=Novisyntrophococcus fermenticellae TaxID=2068655 RepID=UPI001E5704DC|nr:helix-turn-helix transcriptional regulator [Novisyntrophococcus fermenticellae]
MTYTLEILTQLAGGLAKQFGPDCEVVIHDLAKHDLEHSIVYIVNGHISNRKVGDGPSKVVLETLHKNPDRVHDHFSYLTRTSDGRILKSSTMYIRDEKSKEDRKIQYIFSINYDITALMTMEQAVRNIIETEPQAGRHHAPDPIVHNVNDLLDALIQQSVDLAGKPAALMNKDEKVAAIQFLNDAGAFLITKSGDKISKYFGISKFTLYSYIDVNKK